MKKALLAALLFLCATQVSQAQTTIAVSASHIQNAGGGLLPQGSLCFQATDQNNTNIGIQVGGGGIVVMLPYCSAVVNGVVTGFSVPNPANTSPVNVRYRITVQVGAQIIAQFPNSYLCNATGACTSPYTFNFDTCISTSSCISIPIPIVAGPGGPPGANGAAGATGPAGPINQIANNGTNKPVEPIVNLIGAGVACVDNSGATRTDCTFSDSAAFPLTVTGGVSGGIPCFTSTTVEAASTLLAANNVVIGGGVGVCPTASTALPNGTTGTTQSPADNTTKLATDAYVDAAVAAGGGTPAFPITVTGGVSGGIPCFTSTSIEAVSALLAVNQIVLGGGAGVCPSSSTALPNGITATTQSPGDNTTKVATDAFVTTAVAGVTVTPTFPITVAGTVNSGGVPCFTSTTNEASSVLLAANSLVIGGGAGGCVTAATAIPNGTTATTQAPGDATLKVANDAFVTAAVAVGVPNPQALDCSLSAGADIGAKVNACLAALPASGGLADLTHFTSPQTQTTAIVNSYSATIYSCGLALTQNATIELSGTFAHWHDCGSSTFTKGANIDQILVDGSDAAVDGLNLAGNKGSFTGHGIVTGSGAFGVKVLNNNVDSEAGDDIKDNGSTYSSNHISHNTLTRWGVHGFESTGTSQQSNFALNFLDSLDNAGSGAAILNTGSADLVSNIVRDGSSQISIDDSGASQGHSVTANRVQQTAGYTGLKMGANTTATANPISAGGANGPAINGDAGGTAEANFVNVTNADGIDLGNLAVAGDNQVQLAISGATTGKCGINIHGDTIGARSHHNEIIISDSSGGTNYGTCNTPTGTHNLNIRFDADHVSTTLAGGSVVFGHWTNNAANLNTNWSLAVSNLGCVHMTTCIKRTDTQNNVSAYTDIDPGDATNLDNGTGSTNDVFTFHTKKFTFATLPTPIGDRSSVYCTDCTNATPTAGSGPGSFLNRSQGVWAGASVSAVGGSTAKSKEGIVNFNQAAQSQVVVSATEYYITHSDLDMPATYTTAIAAGTTMHWRIALTKTAAGTGNFQILLKKGTNGSTADTSIVTQTIGTQTAAADNMEADISLTWTSTTAAYWTIIPRQSAATGTGFGLVYPAAAAQFSGTISGQTTTTASDKYGLSVIFTTGTPTFVVNEVSAQAFGVN